MGARDEPVTAVALWWECRRAAEGSQADSIRLLTNCNSTLPRLFVHRRDTKSLDDINERISMDEHDQYSAWVMLYR